MFNIPWYYLYLVLKLIQLFLSSPPLSFAEETLHYRDLRCVNPYSYRGSFDRRYLNYIVDERHLI